MKKGADGKLSRVRLLKTQFKHPLVRLEEELAAGENGGAPTITKQNAMVADHLLVKAIPGVDGTRLAEAVRALGGSVLSQIPGSDIYLIKIASTDGQSLPNAIQTLSGLKGIIAYAEPDHIVHATATPNDTRFAEQWNLHNTGQNSGTVDADIDAPEAWDVTTGSNSVVVAVLDSGMDHTHPDLAANVWSNPGEIAGNSLDDDGNGYIDDVRGWSFIGGGGVTTDSNNHGTHVAGIIGAVGNNGVGISGVAWQVKVMPLKFLNSYGQGAVSDAVSAINYARIKGAHIINHSWGVGAYSQPLKDAIDAAGTAGILNVCAADNGYGTNEDVTPNYPSAFTSASVLAVANTTSTDFLSSSSNYGPTSVDLGAPGNNILSTVPGGNYSQQSGTSMATPHVSGIAALVKAFRPALTGTAIKDIIMYAVDPVANLTGKVVTAGRANAATAVSIAGSVGATPASGITSTGNRGGPFSAASATYTVKNFHSTTVNWTAGVSAAPWASVVPTSGTLATGGIAYVTVTINTALAYNAVPGLHERTLVITDTTNNKSITRPVILDVRLPHIYSYDLNTDPGWKRDGWWQYGQPTGNGGNTNNPNPDPTSGATGSNVFGVNLNGNIRPPAGVYSLTAGPFDLRGYTGTKLQFKRWLNTRQDSWDGVHNIEVSNDGGATWGRLWDTYYFSSVSDTTWTPAEISLLGAGDNRAAVLIRWTYQSVSYEPVSDEAFATSSWNIDDIQITGQPGRRILLDGVVSAPENSGTAVLALHIEPPAPTDTTVTLTSSDTSAATVPATIMVPANTSVMNVTAILVDDSLLDGAQTSVLTPALAGYTALPWNLSVADNEATTMTLTLPADAVEGNPYLQGMVTLASAPGRSAKVYLSSNNPLSCSVPAFVLVPAGQTKATFAITVPQNVVHEGTKTIQISASVGGWTGAAASMPLADDDPLALSLSFPFSAGPSNYAENVPSTGFSGTLQLAAPRLVNTVVTLGQTGGSGRLALPATVTILAGSTTAAVSPTLYNDFVKNGVSRITVTATAPGVPGTTAELTMADDEVHSLAFDLIPSPQSPGGTIPVTLRALDVNGQLAAGYTGQATITGHSDGSADPAFSSTSANAVKGVAYLPSITLPTASNAYHLQAVSSGITQSSNAFVVGALAKTVSLTAGDIAYDAATNRIYAATASGTIVPIHPDTGAMETPITVSTTSISQIRISGSGSILYALVDNGTKLVRVDLVSKAVGTPFAINGGDVATDYLILPGTPETVAVAAKNPTSSVSTKVMLFVNGVRAANMLTGANLDSLEPGATYTLALGNQPNRLYAGGSNGKLCLLNTSSTGVTLFKSYATPSTLGQLQSGGTQIYSSSGRLFDAESGVMQDTVNSYSYTNPMVFDAMTSRMAVISPVNTWFDSYDLRVVETNSFSEILRRPVPVVPASPRLVRFGTQGLAYIAASQVVLLTAPAILDPAVPQPDLAIAQVAGPQQANLGVPQSFNILLRNIGSTPASNVVLTNRFPAGMTLVASASTRGTVTQTGDVTTFTLGTIAPGDLVTASVTMLAGTTGTYSNVAQVSSTTSEPHMANNVSTTSVTVADNVASGWPLLKLGATDLAGMKTQNRVLATLGANGGFFASTVAVIDPTTARVLAFVPVGSAPGPVAVADGEESAAVALNSSGLVVPLNVSTWQGGTPYSVGTSADGRNMLVNDIIPVPGRPDRFAIARRGANGAGAGAALYQGNTQVGAATAAGTADVSLAFGATAAELYGHSATSLVRMAVSESGLTVQATGSGQGTGNAQRIQYSNGNVFTFDGRVVRASDLTYVSSLPDNHVGTTICADPARRRIYSAAFSSLAAYDDTTLQKTRTVSPWPHDSLAPKRPLVRWGTTGLAYAATGSSYNGSQSVYSYNNDKTLIVPPPPVTVALPAMVAENAGQLVGGGILRVTEAHATLDRTFNLQSTNPALLQVPASVTLPAGQLTVSFPLTLTDDLALNGARQVSVVPSGPSLHAYETGSTQVTDNEVTPVTLSLPATVAENAGVVTGLASVTIGSPADADMTIQLSSNHALLTVPASVVIPYGSTTVTFPLTLGDDTYLRSTLNVSVTASVAGWAPNSATVAITDNESRAITVTSSITYESYNSINTEIRLGGKVEQPMIINLSSSHPGRLTVPATVTIPAESSSLLFHGIRPVDNTLLDGRQTVTVTAAAAGFISGEGTTVVMDDDPAEMIWTIPSSVTAGTSMNIKVQGWTIDGDKAILPIGSTGLMVSRNGAAVTLATAASLSRASDYSMLTGTAIPISAGADTVLSIVSSGTTRTSPPFTVLAGTHAGFVWNFIDPAGPQPGVPFSVTVKASDVHGNSVNGFSGTAVLAATESQAYKTVGTSTSYDLQPLNTSYQKTRYQTLYTASQMAPGQTAGGIIRSLAFQMIQGTGRAYDQFTIRAKHTARTAPDFGSGWDNDGWTILRQGGLNLRQYTGWVTIPLDTPFAYDGTSNLLLDISFNNSGATASGGTCYSTGTSTILTLCATASSGSSYGSPLTWTTGSNTPSVSQTYTRPNIRFGYGSSVAMSPASTGSFVDGVWSGSVTLPFNATNVMLTAISGTGVNAFYGASNLFDVGSSLPPGAPVLATLPTVTTGASRSLSWQEVTSASAYYVEAATDNTFGSTVASSGWVTSLSHTLPGLISDTLLYFRVKARKGLLEGPWSNIVSTTLDSAGPVITLGPDDTGSTSTFTTMRSTWVIAGGLNDAISILRAVNCFRDGTYYWQDIIYDAFNNDSFKKGSWTQTLNMASPGTFPMSFHAFDSLDNMSQRDITIIRKADTDANGLPDDWQSAHGLALGGANTGRTADFDGDGRSNLLEYAFNTPANSNVGNAYPNLAREVKSADGKTYLVYRHDRRRGDLDLTYKLEFSTNLSTWSGSTFQTEQVGAPVLNPDGITERVTLRILPDVSQPQAKKVFVRMAVTSTVP